MFSSSSMGKSRRLGSFLRKNLLLCLTVSSVLIGILLGFILRSIELNRTTTEIINFPGELFMQILKMMVLPLIFTSVISALGQMNSREAGKMGAITIGYYSLTALLATTVAITLVLTIQPGASTSLRKDANPVTLSNSDAESIDTLFDLLRNMFPDNIFKATFMRAATKYELINGTTHKTVEYVDGTNILGVLVFCTFFGIVLSNIGDQAKIVIDLFVALETVIMSWIETLMWLAPFGIISLICGNLLEVDNLAETLQVLVLYVTTVLLGLFIHMFIVIPTIYVLFTRQSPIPIYKTMIQPFVVAFGTASSGAAIPTSIRCLEESGIDRRIANFVPPLGSTLNVDGNALYEAVAVIFIAQLNNVPLSFANVISICITAILASMGNGSVPAGLVTMVLILNTVGLPIKDISLIITVDWLIDRIRTAINVMSDGFAASVVAHYVDETRRKDPVSGKDYRSIGKDTVHNV